MLSENQAFKVFLDKGKGYFYPVWKKGLLLQTARTQTFLYQYMLMRALTKTARGIETYLLNWTNDEESIRVAARENAISLKKMKAQMNKLKE